MKVITGDLFSYYGKENFIICITTNGSVKKNGCAVMGRGCALEAKNRLPVIDSILGDQIKQHGNSPYIFVASSNPNNPVVNDSNNLICTFPVKHQWWEKADINLISKSAKTLVTLSSIDRFKHIIFVIPRPGCGAGGLNWEKDVKPILSNILISDNFWIIHND